MKRKYSILVNYDSGDSFGRHPNQEVILTEEWDDIEIAKENIKRIEEHYRAYRKINDYTNYGKGAWGDYKNERWYSLEYPDHGVILSRDDGSTYKEYCDWCGYFESLNYVEITSDNSDTKISFEN